MRVNRHSTKFSDRRANTRKDKLLFWVLLAFNIWSGITTILGAQEILPLGLAVACGITVQLMLLLLLSGLVMKGSFFRRWLAILAFSSVSIYTSFFCYYGVLTKDISQIDEKVLATDAHQSLVADVYTPLQERVRDLEAEVAMLEDLAIKESDEGITSDGAIGCGPRCLDFKLQATNVNRLLTESKRQVESLAPKFEYDLEELSPDEIYRKDREALSAVPADDRNDYTLDYKDYFDPLSTVSFITPYSKVFVAEEREIAAVFSLLIALSIDGTSIVQGSAIQRGKGEGTISHMSKRIKNLILAWKSGRANVMSAFNPYASVDWNDLHEIVITIHRESGGKGIQFLSLLRNSIDKYRPHIVNSSSFNSRDNAVFAHGFTEVRDRLVIAGLVIHSDSSSTEPFVVDKDRIDEVWGWIQKEIENLSKSSSSSKDNKFRRRAQISSAEAEHGTVNKGWDDVVKTFKNRNQDK